VKKNRLLTAAMIGILTAAMAVTVYAGGGSGVSTYEELVEFMESEQGGSLWGITPAEDFGWPEEEITLVFDDWRGLNVWEDWTIPENVTIIAEEDFTSYGATVTVDGTLICNGLTNNYFKPEHANPNPDKSYQERYADTNLIVNGSVTLKYYQDDRFFQNITINDGGVLKANIIVDESGSLTVNQGGTIDTIASVKIYGKAEFSGEITLPWIDALGGTVTVTETGVVYCGNIYQLEKAEIAGDLFVRGGINLSNYESSDEFRQYGTIELKETGKLHLLPWTRVFGQSENSGITGNGTLCVYKCLEEEQPEYPQIFGVKMEEWQENEIIEGVSSDVTIRANWTQPDECEHTFVKSPYVVKSSCVDGYTVYLCSKCDNPVKRDITVIGISRDDVASHKKFANKYDLPFVLLSDPNLDAINAYGVWQEKKLYGKISFGVVRTTFIVDEKGNIQHIIPKVKPDTNAREILDAL